MATYGEGDPTDNAQEFYDWLQRGDAELNGLNYAVSFSVFSGGTKKFTPDQKLSMICYMCSTS
jgi:sulfite reductase alpha subunit-like flavoprotein